MSMAPQNDAITGGTVLRIPALQSPNFVTGSTGWIVRGDGSVEFNNGTFRGSVVVGTSPGSHIQVGGASNAILIYDSGNNLIASIAPASGTDSNGNQYLQGISSYNLSAPAKFSQIVGGRLVFGQIKSGVPDLTDAGAIVANATNVMTQILAMSTGTGATTNPPNFQMFAGDINQATGSTGAPQVFLSDVASNSATDLYLSGSVIKTNNSGVAYTWQTPTAATNWAIDNLKYRLDAENNVVWVGQLHYTGANVAGANAASVISAAVPAIYRPSIERLIPVTHLTSLGVQKNVAASVRLETTGGVSIFWGSGMAGTANDVNGLATGDAFYVEARVPVGNLA